MAAMQKQQLAGKSVELKFIFSPPKKIRSTLVNNVDKVLNNVDNV